MPRADMKRKRCAIYTRKSSEEGLEQEFNSLAAQRAACEAYIRSQQHEGWTPAKTRYDDGGFSGGNMERPASQRLLADIRAGRIDIVVVCRQNCGAFRRQPRGSLLRQTRRWRETDSNHRSRRQRDGR